MNTENQPEITVKRRRPVRLIVILLLVLVAVGVTPFLIRTLVTQPIVGITTDLERVAAAVKSTLNLEPEVLMKTQVIQSQVSPIAELAVAEREMRISLFWSEQWLKSTKKIKMLSPFRVKAGFDLEKPIRVIYDPEKAEKGINSVRIELPRAEILSVERFGEIDYSDESGWWNKIRDEDRGKALNALQNEAARLARESDLCRKAEKIIAEKLENLLSESGIDLEIVFLEDDGSNQKKMTVEGGD